MGVAVALLLTALLEIGCLADAEFLASGRVGAAVAVDRADSAGGGAGLAKLDCAVAGRELQGVG